MAGQIVERVPTPPLPPDAVPLPNQVSGHFYGRQSTKLGMLQLKDGTLVKPLIPPKGDAELKFYEDIYNPDTTNEVKECLRPLLANYYGVWTTPLHQGVQYLMLENVTCKYQKPCVMDVKVGLRTWHPSASEEKRLGELRKYPPQQEVGFRLLGMKVYHAERDAYEQHDNIYLRSLQSEDLLPKGFAVFLNATENPGYKRHILKSLLNKLHKIQAWFSVQTLYHFYASSLLLVYEGLPLGGIPEDVSDLQAMEGDLTDVRLIDFTHVFPADGQQDINYLTGVERLIERLQNALSELFIDL